MGMSKELYQNAKKPQGSGGKFVINRMNERHRHLAKWGFSNLDIKEPKDEQIIQQISLSSLFQL